MRIPPPRPDHKNILIGTMQSSGSSHQDSVMDTKFHPIPEKCNYIFILPMSQIYISPIISQHQDEASSVMTIISHQPLTLTTIEKTSLGRIETNNLFRFHPGSSWENYQELMVFQQRHWQQAAESTNLHQYEPPFDHRKSQPLLINHYQPSLTTKINYA